MSGRYIGRWLFTREGLVEGCIRLSEGRLDEIRVGSPPPGSEKAVVLPSFVNAHTHLGDAGAYPAPELSVAELVAPPDGYKHRVLRSMARADKVAAMRKSVEIMLDTGTCEFADFREEGVEGVDCIKEAIGDLPIRSKVLGRPSGDGDIDRELPGLIERADGIGMSGIRDWPRDLLSKVSRLARSSGKLFSIHASEVEREDIDEILDLEPSFLVHMTRATEGDLARCAEEHVPIVVCPQTYEFFGLSFDLRRMIDAGLTVGIGTDNAMISRPEMLEAVRAAHRSGHVSPSEALKLAVFGGRKVLYANAKITTDITDEEDLVAVRVEGENPLVELASASRPEDVVATVMGGMERRKRSWMR
jgi:cytosine/adenosine deaminase-related metal-dependent hydrolase